MKRTKIGVITALLVVLVVGGAGTYLFARSNAQSLDSNGNVSIIEPAKASLLKPLSLGYSPYQYVAYSGSIDQSRQATKVSQYFAAFVISDGSCNPTWGGSSAYGMSSQRASDLQSDFAKVKAAGGNVAISFGGSNGTELAVACKSADDLAAAYDKVITMYDSNRIDFDIEGPALNDTDATVRRAEAAAKLQQLHPGLQIYLTLPVRHTGMTSQGVGVVSAFINAKVVISGINVMAMNYNQVVTDMGAEAETVATASVAQLTKLYPNNSSSDIWKALGITVMVGANDTPKETFTLANAGRVRSFADQKGVGTLSIWNIGRDAPCTDPTTPQPSVSCSGQPQNYYDYTWALILPARD